MDEKNWFSVGYYHPKILKSLKLALSKSPVEIIDPHLTKKVPNKRGKGVKVTKERAYIGYCFLECKPEDWQNIFLTVEKVDGVYFPALRDKKGYPLPITQQEIDKVQALMVNEVTIDLTVSAGDEVTVIEGAFNGMRGTITSVDEGRGIISVMLNVFDRDTNVDLNASSVRKE